MRHSRFDEPAERWVPGEGPVEVQPLAFGLVNESCRVTRAGRTYSLRIAAADERDLGLDRRWECAVRKRAGVAGLAPAVRCCRPKEGILVAEWAEGRAWSAAEARRPENIDRMAQLLRRVHALDIPRPARRMDPAAWIAHYRAAMARTGPGVRGAVRRPTARLRSAEFERASEARLAVLAGHPAFAAVLCHGDLHRLNVLIRDRPLLLDWEYAHVSAGIWDLAGWVANNDWGPVEAGRLLAAYLQRPPDAADLDCVRTCVWLYDYVCLLWSELYASRACAKGEEVAVRAEFLAARLGSKLDACPVP